MTAIGSYTDGHKLLRGTGNPLRPWAFFASQESLFCASAKAEVKVVAQGMGMLNTLGNSMVFFPAGNLDISLLCLDAEQFPQSTYESLPFHSFCLFVCFCGLNKNVDVTLSKLTPPAGCFTIFVPLFPLVFGKKMLLRSFSSKCFYISPLEGNTRVYSTIIKYSDPKMLFLIICCCSVACGAGLQ